jgi:hypothetical protein
VKFEPLLVSVWLWSVLIIMCVCLDMLVCIIELGEVFESCLEVFLCPCEVSWVEVTRRNVIGFMIKMQVSQPFVMQESYLRSAEQRYRGFLYLFTLNKGLFLVPTYDIDIMWWVIITNFVIFTNSTFVWRMLFHICDLFSTSFSISIALNWRAI